MGGFPKSGYKNINWDAVANKWRVRMRGNSFGSFTYLFDAVTERDRVLEEYKRLDAANPPVRRRRAASRHSKSGIVGISLCKTTGKWHVRVKQKSIGRFESIVDATFALREAESEVNP